VIAKWVSWGKQRSRTIPYAVEPDRKCEAPARGSNSPA